MASSDDDEEILPEVVSDYYFYDAGDEPVSFTALPIQWSNGERSDDNKSRIYLRGNADNGLQKVHKLVKAWKYEFLKEKPEISVLFKDNNWIKLQKPRKSYDNKIRTILITMQSLYLLSRNPKASSKVLRDHLCKVFSLYDIRPSENDLMDHLKFIREAVKRDETLQKSKVLASLLERRSRKKRAFDQDAEAVMKPSFIVDDTVFEYENCVLATKGVEDGESESESESDNDHDDSDGSDVDVNDDEDDLSDNVCAICDNGGNLTCCDGKCLRSFHATLKSTKSAKSNCKSLGLQPEEVKGSRPFVCLNCSLEQHQCFVCGKLGSSNKSYGAEVFQCSSAACGHFYHPYCVARLLVDENDGETRNLEQKITGGEPFTCPTHKCHKCKQGEDEKVKGLTFAVCRRCPRSYHRKCLPSKIVFYNKDIDNHIVARAWNNLLPKSRALIYCLKHKMDHKLGTAVRNIKFPDISRSWKNISWKNITVNENIVNSDYTSDEISVEKSASSVRPVDSSNKSAEMSFGSERAKKQRVSSVTNKKFLLKNLSIEAERDSIEDHILVEINEQTPIVAENDNIVTRDPYEGATHERPDNKSIKLDSTQQGYGREAHIDEPRNYGICSSGQKTAYTTGRHNSGFSSRYQLAASDNRYSTFAMNQYTPRLDELNHTWMAKNRRMWVNDQPVQPHMDYSFSPRRYQPIPHNCRYHHIPHHYPHHPLPHHYLHHPDPRHYAYHPVPHHVQSGRMNQWVCQ